MSHDLSAQKSRQCLNDLTANESASNLFSRLHLIDEVADLLRNAVSAVQLHQVVLARQNFELATICNLLGVLVAVVMVFVQDVFTAEHVVYRHID